MPRKIVQEITAVDRTQRAFSSVERSVGRLQGVLAGLGATVSVAAFANLTRQAINSADEIGKLSQRLGASTEALSEYRFAAELTGVSFRTLTLGFQRMTRRVSEAAQGTGEARNALKELGLDAIELNRLAPEEQFEVLADAIIGIKNPADQVRLAMKLFDSEGVALIQTMQGGSEAIQGMREEARRMGLTLTKEAAEGASEAKNAMTRLGASSDALAVVLATNLSPALADVADFLANVLPPVIDFFRESFADMRADVLEVTESITGQLGRISAGLGAVFTAVGAEDAGRRLSRFAASALRSSDIAGRAAKRFRDDFGKSLEVELKPRERGKSFADLFNEGIAAAFAEGQGAGGRGTSAAASRLQKQFNQDLSELQGIINATLTPLERYQQSLARLNDLREQFAGTANAITEEQYLRAVERLGEELDRASGAQERFNNLRQVIDEVDPVAPLLRQLDALEELQREFPAYADLVAEKMLDVQDAIDGVTAASEDQAEKVKELVPLSRELGNTFTSAFEDAIVKGGDLSSVLDGLAQDLLRISTRELFTRPLQDALGGIFSSIGFRQFGGPVSAGRPYVVGEKGPELFIPNQSGHVAPAGEAGSHVTINVNTPDASSFLASQQQVLTAMQVGLARAQRNL